MSTTYKVRSLFDFEDEEKRKLAAYQEAHPVSTVDSANNSENEVERDEIKTAQRMPVQLTHVFSDSDVDRSVQVIYRGDFSPGRGRGGGGAQDAAEVPRRDGHERAFRACTGVGGGHGDAGRGHARCCEVSGRGER